MTQGPDPHGEPPPKASATGCLLPTILLIAVLGIALAFGVYVASKGFLGAPALDCPGPGCPAAPTLE